MNFNERVHLQIFFREAAQARKRFVVERGDDEQQSRRARSSRFIKLILIKNNILAQQRQRVGRANRAQVSERALKRSRQ